MRFTLDLEYDPQVPRAVLKPKAAVGGKVGGHELAFVGKKRRLGTDRRAALKSECNSGFRPGLNCPLCS